MGAHGELQSAADAEQTDGDVQPSRKTLSSSAVVHLVQVTFLSSSHLATAAVQCRAAGTGYVTFLSSSPSFVLPYCWYRVRDVSVLICSFCTAVLLVQGT